MTLFSFKVDEVLSTEVDGFGGTPIKAKIPKGLPKYKKGKTVKFKIGNKATAVTMTFTRISGPVFDMRTYTLTYNMR